MDQESDNRGCAAKPARNETHNTIVNLQNYCTENYSDQEPAKAPSGSQDDLSFELDKSD